VDIAKKFSHIGILRKNSHLSLYNFLREDLKEATRATALAKDSAADAKEAMDAADKIVKAVSTKATEVNKSFEQLQQRMNAETGDIRALLAKDIETLGSRLNGIEKLMTEVSKKSIENSMIVAKYKESTANELRVAEAKKGQFLANSEYFIHLSNISVTKESFVHAVEEFTSAGFKTSENITYEEPENTVVVYGPGDNTRKKAEEIRKKLSSMGGFGKVTMQPGPLGIEEFTEKNIGVFLVGKL